MSKFINVPIKEGFDCTVTWRDNRVYVRYGTEQHPLQVTDREALSEFTLGSQEEKRDV